ncbi:hypothetical protein DRJ04_07215 [Candidatus Aerophobetes bacterium]|uniref:Amino acid permease n=1 Tax=Aerophobetes bacterium TaxID=2030807 RepID=A0A662DBI3_UNCAE|nr:MAG: hypothetical protein DRJ04_07215 [Candidatus Aerophobetes bacterium]
MAEIKSELSRELNLFHITMMGLGMMIGAGVFLGIGNSIYIAGPGGAILTFALNGLIAMMTAMSYAELSSAIPHAGGAYNFARIGFGKGASFMAGWMEWFASSVAGSVYAHTFSIYTMRYLETLGLMSWFPYSEEIGVKLFSVIIAGLFIYINYRGAQETGKFGAFFTMGQTTFLVIIGLAGFYVAIKDPARIQNLRPFLPYGWRNLLITMGFTYVAFEGFEVISQAGDETINPRKNLPKAMILSVFVVTLTYVSVAFATLVSVKEGMPGVEAPVWKWIGSFREKGFGEAVSFLMPFGNVLLTIAVIFASTSALNATIYSASRVSYALGRDNMLPGFFSRISRKTKTPYVALIFTSFIILSIAVLLPTIHVASSASIMFLFLFFLANLSAIRVRWRMGEELIYGYKMPLFPLFPIVAVLIQIVLSVWLVHMSVIAWIVAVVWISIGFTVYNTFSRTRAKLSPHDIQILEEEKVSPEVDERYRIMVAVSNPENSIRLVRSVYKLCSAKEANIELIHMVEVPDQVPLSDAHLYMLKGKEAIVEAMLYLAPAFSLTTTVRYCRNVSRGIVTATREKKVDLLVMGFPQKSTMAEFRFGKNVDQVIDKAPCHVILLKGETDKRAKKILVPISGGPNSTLALEVAIILVEDGGTVVPFYVAGGKTTFDMAGFLRSSLGKMGLKKDVDIESKIVLGDDVAEGICREGLSYDLVVMGVSPGIGFTRGKSIKVPELVARRSTFPVIFVKETSGVRSLVRKVL